LAGITLEEVVSLAVAGKKEKFRRTPHMGAQAVGPTMKQIIK
jgi:hypothetical protein